jgi:hypothetical protein
VETGMGCCDSFLYNGVKSICYRRAGNPSPTTMNRHLGGSRLAVLWPDTVCRLTVFKHTVGSEATVIPGAA